MPPARVVKMNVNYKTQYNLYWHYLIHASYMTEKRNWNQMSEHVPAIKGRRIETPDVLV
jgi:hypothetical protein